MDDMCGMMLIDMHGVRYANNLLKNPATKRLSGKTTHTHFHNQFPTLRFAASNLFLSPFLFDYFIHTRFQYFELCQKNIYLRKIANMWGYPVI